MQTHSCVSVRSASCPILRNSKSLPRPIVITEYVARHELSSIDREIRDLEGVQVLRVEPVLRRNADFRRLLAGGADKGEAEAIAWALAVPRGDRPLFVSLDDGARGHARDNAVPAGDIMDWLIDLIEAFVLTYSEAEQYTAPWLDQRQQRGRPRDFTTFAETFARRRGARGGTT